MLSPQRGNLMSAQSNALGINAKEHHEAPTGRLYLAAVFLEPPRWGFVVLLGIDSQSVALG